MSGLDLAEAFRVAERVALSARSITEGRAEIVQWCQEMHPHPSWAKFHQLDYAADQQRIAAWLSQAVTVSPPTENSAFLWFSLGDEGSDLGVVGYPWDPFEEDPIAPCVWDPETTAQSTVLLAINDIAFEEGDDALEDEAAYPLSLGYAGLALRLSLESLDPALILGNSNSLRLLLGFDGGDYIDLGQLTAAGRAVP